MRFVFGGGLPERSREPSHVNTSRHEPSPEHLLSSVVVRILCSFCSILHLSYFLETVRTWSLFRQRRTGHGRQNSNDVCDIPFFLLFPIFPFFSPFYLSSFSLFSPSTFAFTFSNFPLFSSVPHEAQDNETNATCCERGCCLFLGIFMHIQKKGS